LIYFYQMKKTLFILLLGPAWFLGFSATSFLWPGQFGETKIPPAAEILILSSGPDSAIAARDLFPDALENEIIINRTGYTISYNCTYNIANWVAWELTANETKAKVRRKNNFKPDPMLEACHVVPADYNRSGYDKGHLAPSADMCWSVQAMEESFYMTNMAPQKPRFNRGMWKRLEDQTRDWAVENKTIFIVTGPVLKSGLAVIGKNRISVPEAFFRVILDFSEPQVKGIAFIMDNKRLTGSLAEFAVSIDSVERLTGLDLFYSLPDDMEAMIEASFNPNKWLWNGKPFRRGEEEPNSQLIFRSPNNFQYRGTR